MNNSFNEDDYYSQNQIHYRSLTNEILKIFSQTNKRLLIAISGPPGSGKSYLAADLAELLNHLLSTETAIVVGLDGWHYPNDYLDTHFIQKNQTNIPLRRIKGSPETFNAAAAIECLRCIKNNEDKAINYPIYSREIHNPIPNAAQVLPCHKLIICEGNYWLLNEPPWLTGIPLFDLRIFIQIELNTLLPALRERHSRGGKTDSEIERQLKVDLENAERITHNSVPPHIVIKKDNPFLINQIKTIKKLGEPP